MRGAGRPGDCARKDALVPGAQLLARLPLRLRSQGSGRRGAGSFAPQLLPILRRLCPWPTRSEIMMEWSWRTDPSRDQGCSPQHFPLLQVLGQLQALVPLSGICWGSCPVPVTPVLALRSFLAFHCRSVVPEWQPPQRTPAHCPWVLKPLLPSRSGAASAPGPFLPGSRLPFAPPPCTSQPKRWG